MKRLALPFILIFPAIAAKAQVGYNYKEFGIGLDISYQRAYSNVNRQHNHFGENINFIYNYSPYIPVVAELQFGKLSGSGLTPNLDRYGRQYTNNYEALILHADFQLGEVIDYSQSAILNIIKTFYFGPGEGFVFNNNTVQRYNIYPWNGPLTYRFPGSDNSINMDVPLRFGY